MRIARIIGVLGLALGLTVALGAAFLPRATEMTTGSIAVATAPASGAALSCDQALYQDELELLTGLNCG
jgi:hypothetical protein